jgi:hypothetical protein
MAKLIKFALISVAIYLAIMAVLISANRPTAIVNAEEPMTFEALAIVDYESMPDLQLYTTRDGSKLPYRFYESAAETKNVLILLHGSGWHSMQFHPLAEALRAQS